MTWCLLEPLYLIDYTGGVRITTEIKGDIHDYRCTQGNKK
jgi:hypothetical protein